MWKDPIVEEVRKVREEHAAKFNFDIRAIVEDARRRQCRSKHKLVSFLPAEGKTPHNKALKRNRASARSA